MQYSKFVVDIAPYCVWEWDLAERDLEFINSIDPKYFLYLADVHARALENDASDQHAALALRTAYVHALETFFALLFATIQAPDCIVGWLHKYQIRDLRNLIEKIDRRQPVFSKLRIDPFTWQGIASAVLSPLSLEDKEKEQRIKQRYGELWQRLAREFRDEATSKEYNSIKHGLRVKAGGFTLAIGLEDTPGVPAPRERMRSMGGSEFGASYFVPERIGDHTLHFRVRRYSRNWRPERFVYGLHLLSFSMENILGFVKIGMHQVDPGKVTFCWPSDDAAFDELWKPIGGPTGFSMVSVIHADHIKAFSKEEILEQYREDEEPEESN